VAAGRRDFERALDVLLVAHISEVGPILQEGAGEQVFGGDGGRDRRFAAQVGDEPSERTHGDDRDLADERGFERVDGGDVDGGDAAFAGERDHGQDAGGVAQRAIEAEFTRNRCPAGSSATCSLAASSATAIGRS